MAQANLDAKLADPSLFPILEQMDFFNHAGVAPISGPAAQALRQYAYQAEHQAYHHSGWYRRVGEVRRSAAQLIHADSPQEIAFIPNTSTGLALVARGIDWQPGDRIVITDVEYPANRYPWVDAVEHHGLELVEVKQRSDGRIHVEDVIAAIGDRCRLVSISHVQYASGHRIDPRPIADAVHGAGGWLCLDAIQSCGVLPIDVQAMGVDFLSADGHKWMLGPEGCGIFYCRRELCEKLHPAIVGWMNMVDAANYGNYRFEFQKDARRFEPGSWNIPGILALGASLDLLLELGIEAIWQRVESLTQRLTDGLQQIGCNIFTPREISGERSGIVIFDPPESMGQPAEIVQQLEAQNIIIVVREGRLRVSPHFYNTAKQIERLLKALVKLSN